MTHFRHWLQSSAFFCIAFAVGTAGWSADVPDLRSRTSGSDWPSFLGPTGDGKSPETGIVTDWSKGLRVVYTLEVGEGYSAPTTSLGRLFFFDRDGDRARLRCLKSESGELLWSQDYGTDYVDMYGYSGGPRTSPVVDGDRLYAFGVEGRLRAHRVTDGKVLWDVDTEARYGVQQNFFGVGATPVVEGDLLIVPIGGSPKGSPGISSGKAKPNGTGVVAFDKRTGEERYRLGDELASYASPVLATSGDRRWAFVFARGGLLAFEPTSGKLDFRVPWRAKLLESVNAASPVVVGDRLFLTEAYGPGALLLKFRPGGFDEVWRDGRRNQSFASHWSTPIHHGGYLYGSSGRSSGNSDLRCVDMATGEVKWKQPGLRRSTQLFVDGHLVALGEYGELWLVKARPDRFEKVAETVLEDDGKPLLRHPAWNSPVLSHGLLYLVGKGRMVAVELIPPSR
ncbi:MAG: PQQ-binding-like beta-propeller repeat protein [Acidobacteriota bacterium]